MSPSLKTASNKIVSAVLIAAEKTAFDKITPELIARKTKTPLPKIQKFFSTTEELLSLLVDHIDLETFHSLQNEPVSAEKRDILFTSLMARFDILQKNRKAHLAIGTCIKSTPTLLKVMVKKHWHFAEKLTDMVNLNDSKEGFWPLFLFGIYTTTLLVWSRDESQDLSKTMAHLNAALLKFLPSL